MAAHVGASEDIGRIVRQLRRERLQRVALFGEGRQVLGEVIERMGAEVGGRHDGASGKATRGPTS